MHENPQKMSNFEDVGDFHTKFGLRSFNEDGGGPTLVDRQLLQFRLNFLLEELTEAVASAGGFFEVKRTLDDLEHPNGTLSIGLPEGGELQDEQLFDALLDITYVAMGTAHLMGYPWEAGWDEVQRANMSKVRAKADGSDSARGSSFDVVKPEGWRPPDINKVLDNNGFAKESTK